MVLKFNRREFTRVLAGSGSIGLLGAAIEAKPQNVTGIEPRPGSITDVQGVTVGHYRDSRRPTGCTAILFDNEVSAGVDYDGSAPGEQLGVMLQPTSLLEGIHGILLAGGGPMGLAAVPGAVKYLDEHHIGYDWGVPNIRVPIVVGAVIDDLPIGDGRIRPDAEAGYKACQAASAGPVAEGNVGAGAGATVGKMLRAEGYPGMKGGLGTASLRLGEIVIGALAVVNAAGDILD
jgi:L-aminopeptidase/D-esterase-like protein